MAADQLTTPDPWLTVKGAAAHALVSDTTILRAARLKKIVGYKINSNRVWRFRRSAVDSWLQSQVPDHEAEQAERQHHLRVAGR